jgi:predicted GNAT superfamily acetyltransferase
MEGINRGLPSDRLLVEWEVAPQGARAEGAALDLPLPDDLEALVARDPAAALALRLALRAGLTRAFAEGRRITGFDRARRVYLLG